MRQAVGVGRLRTSTEKLLSGGQHVESPATRRAARTGRYEAPFEGCQQPVDLGPPQASRVGATCSHKPRNTSPLARQVAGGDSPPRQRSIQCNASNSRRSRVSPSTPGLPPALPGRQAARPARPRPCRRPADRSPGQGRPPGSSATRRWRPCHRRAEPAAAPAGIQAQSPARRLAEHMQAVADLRLLQVAEIGVQLRQPAVRIVAELQADLAVETVVAQEDENLAAQLFGAARVEQRGIVELVGQALQVAQRAVARRGSAAASGGR